ncbi:MAG: hypothetical protein ACFB6R_09350 [Alphaproteobacteria bacterium]
MAFEGVPLMGMIKRKMEWLGARQQVLARNVAHADTPGYRAQDLKRPDFQRLMAGESEALPMRRSAADHMASAPSAGRFAPERVGAWETVPDGNSVTVEEQMLKVTETVGEYRLATNIYSKSVNLLRTAIGGR